MLDSPHSLYCPRVMLDSPHLLYCPRLMLDSPHFLYCPRVMLSIRRLRACHSSPTRSPGLAIT